MGKVTKVKEEEEEEEKGREVREESRCAARTRTEEGQKRAKGARSFVRFSIPSFLAYRSRGPGRTILLDLCALVRLLVPHGAPLYRRLRAPARPRFCSRKSCNVRMLLPFFPLSPSLSFSFFSSPEFGVFEYVKADRLS